MNFTTTDLYTINDFTIANGKIQITKVNTSAYSGKIFENNYDFFWSSFIFLLLFVYLVIYIMLFQIVTNENKIIVNMAACGALHTITLSNDGTLHSFGSNESGQLGLGRK